MTNLPRLTKLKAQKAAPMIVAHVKELLSEIKLEDSKQYTIKVKTSAEPHSDEEKKFWRYQSFFTLEFCKAIEEVLPSQLAFYSYNHLTNDLTLVRR